MCTELDVFTESTKYKVNNICHQKTPDGKQTSAIATLKPEGAEGHFVESFSAFAPGVDYTIIELGEYNGEHYSVEYDCSSNLLGTNYCVHFMAREPTMSDELLQELLSRVNALKLNSQNLPLQMTLQEGCWTNELL